MCHMAIIMWDGKGEILSADQRLPGHQRGGTHWIDLGALNSLSDSKVWALLMGKAMSVATKLAEGPAHALQYTKRALNLWLNRTPLNSCALEMCMHTNLPPVHLRVGCRLGTQTLRRDFGVEGEAEGAVSKYQTVIPTNDTEEVLALSELAAK